MTSDQAVQLLAAVKLLTEVVLAFGLVFLVAHALDF